MAQTLDEIDTTILTGTAVLSSMADIHPQARECQDSLEGMRVATMQMCLLKPGSTNPTSIPQAVPASADDQIPLQTEESIPPDLANTLTNLFPGADGSINNVPPTMENQGRYFGNMGQSQGDKEESFFSLDFLDIELFPGRLSNDPGSILGR